MFELPDVEDLEEVVVTAETVDDGKQPEYVKSDSKKKKKASKSKSSE
jgi:ATP-dependent protease Clp ATPase subunit